MSKDITIGKEHFTVSAKTPLITPTIFPKRKDYTKRLFLCKFMEALF